MEQEIIGSFEVITNLGSGPRAGVYRARHLTLGRIVAIKQLQVTVTAESPEFSRLQAEIDRVRAVASNNVLATLSVDLVDGRPLIEMESLGDSLEKVLRKGPLSLTHALGVVHNILTGLRTLHEAGIVHGNLKPSNVLQDTTTGEWKIADGGITAIESESSPTLLATAMLHLAPECMSRPPDSRSDLYSAGMIGLEAVLGPAALFEAFAPLTRSAPPSRWLAWLEDRQQSARPLAELRPQIPLPVSQFFASLIAKDPERRPVSADSALAELESILPLADGMPTQLSGSEESVTEIRPAFPTAAIGAVPQLVVKGPAGFERKIDLIDQRTYRIGRDAQNDIVLPDDTKAISRMHAELRYEGEQFVVHDLESQNGIWVSGRRTPTARLEPGVTVKIGPYTLAFSAPADATKTRDKAKAASPVAAKSAAAASWWPPRNAVQWSVYGAAAAAVLAVGIWLAWPAATPTAPDVVVELTPSAPVPEPPPAPSTSTPEPTARDKSLELGRQLLAEGKLNDALKEAEQLLTADPNDAEAQALKNQAQEGLKLLASKSSAPSGRPAGNRTQGSTTPAAAAVTPPKPVESESDRLERQRQARLEEARTAENSGNLVAAVKAYEDAGDSDNVQRVRKLMMAEAALAFQNAEQLLAGAFMRTGEARNERLKQARELYLKVQRYLPESDSRWKTAQSKLETIQKEIR